MNQNVSAQTLVQTSITAHDNVQDIHPQRTEEIPRPQQPRNVAGPHEVCPGSSEYYTAEATSDDYFILWKWDVGLADSAEATGERVMVKFGQTASDIRVYQVDRRTGCRSEAVVWPTYLFAFDAWPYGQPVRVCEGQSFNLNQLPDHPDVPVLYKWYTTEHLAHTLTVVGDNLERNVQVMTNYSAPSVAWVPLYLDRTACGVTITDQVLVNIGVIDPPVILSGPYCSHVHSRLDVASPEYNINADQQQTYWEVEGVGTVGGLPARVVFPHAGTYTVVLHYVSRYGCEATATQTVTVNEFPDLALEEVDGQLCVTGTGGQPFDYIWSPTGNTDRCEEIHTGTMACLVCAENGCCTTLTYVPPEPPCVEEAGYYTVTQICYNIVEVALNDGVPLPAKLSFLCNGNVVGGEVTLETYTCRLLVPERCVDQVRVSWIEDDRRHCDTEEMLPIDVDPWLAFGVSGDCDGNIVVEDRTEYSSAHPAIWVEVRSGGATLFSGQLENSLTIPAFAGSTVENTYSIRFLIGSSSDCYIDLYRQFGPQLQILNLPSEITLCDRIPALFSADIVGCVREARWNFGDGSYNFGSSLYHSYRADGPFRVRLDVTGCNMCQVGHSINVTVERNDIVRKIAESPTDVICYGSPKVMKYRSMDGAFADNNNYYWTWPSQVTLRDGQNEMQKLFDVTEGGDIRVLEVNPDNGCKGEAAGNIDYPNEIPAHISCSDAYCEGEEALAIGNGGGQFTYQWQLRGSGGSLVGSSTAANYRFTVPDAVGCRLELTVTDDNECSESDSKDIVINARPEAPAIYFDVNACITEGAVELAVPPLHPKAVWSNGLNGYTATYYTGGPASAYYIDANGCHSRPGRIAIPQPPDFNGLLTGCYPMCERIGGYTSVYALGIEPGLDWAWLRYGTAVRSGTVPTPPNAIPLPVVAPGSYRLMVDYGRGCKAVSPVLELSPLDCSETHHGMVPNGSEVGCIVKGLQCEKKGCAVQYTADVILSNQLSTAVTLATIYSSGPMPTSLTPSLPLTIPAGGSVAMSLTFLYDFTTPAAVRFELRDIIGACRGSFALDLSQSMGCLAPDSCSDSVSLTYSINGGLTAVLRVAYYDITCTSPTSGNQIIKVWCDGPGEMVSETSGNPYTGLFMISYARLTQMVANEEEFCFNVLMCKGGDAPCVKQECKRARDMYEELSQLVKGNAPSKRAGVQQEGEAAHYALRPNPTTGIVEVVDAATGGKARGVKSVTVLSLLGQVLVSGSGDGEMDLSFLPQGSYMVKVVGRKGEVEHLKLVKMQ